VFQVGEGMAHADGFGRAVVRQETDSLRSMSTLEMRRASLRFSNGSRNQSRRRRLFRSS
jgi:hypothetical protein